jgi:hypothetical protein
MRLRKALRSIVVYTGESLFGPHRNHTPLHPFAIRRDVSVPSVRNRLPDDRQEGESLRRSSAVASAVIVVYTVSVAATARKRDLRQAVMPNGGVAPGKHR